MSPSTDSPPDAVETASSAEAVDVIDPASPDAAGRTFGRVRGQRLEITSADLTMYSVITGRAPSREERERALTWSEADPMNDQLAGMSGGGAGGAVAASAGAGGAGAILPVHAMHPWHPTSLSVKLRELWVNGFTLRVKRPQLGHWMRRFSLALQQGRRRVRQPR